MKSDEEIINLIQEMIKTRIAIIDEFKNKDFCLGGIEALKDLLRRLENAK